MRKEFNKPLVEIFEVDFSADVIVTSGSPLAKYGLGWFVLPDKDYTA